MRVDARLARQTARPADGNTRDNTHDDKQDGGDVEAKAGNAARLDHKDDNHHATGPHSDAVPHADAARHHDLCLGSKEESMSNFLSRIGREPVLIGATVLAWIDVAHPSDLVKAALVATVAMFVRAYSSPKVAVEEAHAAGYDNAVADVASLTVTAPPKKRPAR